MDGAEIARLIDSGTITAILRSACPHDGAKDITHYNPKPKEKYDAATDIVTRCIRGIIGGDKVNYPGLVSASTADLFTVKSFLHSVVSDRRNFKIDTRFASLDIVDFFLGTPLERPEFVLISTKLSPKISSIATILACSSPMAVFFSVSTNVCMAYRKLRNSPTSISSSIFPPRDTFKIPMYPVFSPISLMA